MSNRPILVVNIPRSGSSLVTGLIHKFGGAWVGETREPDEFNPKGYFENKRLNRIMRKLRVPDASFRKRVLNIRQMEKYEKGPWVVKASLNKWKLWEMNGFEPFWIICRRDEAAIYKSFQRHKNTRNMTSKQIKTAIESKTRILDLIKRQHKKDVFEIQYEDLIKGDYTALKNMFEACGLNWDEDKIRGFIEKDMDHSNEERAENINVEVQK